MATTPRCWCLTWPPDLWIVYFVTTFTQEFFTMFTSLQNPLALAARLLLVALFLPAGISKLTGFAGTVG